MTNPENNSPLPHETKLERELSKQAKQFEIKSSDQLNNLILGRLAQEHAKQKKRNNSIPFEWVKLGLAASIFVCVGLIYFYNSQILNSVLTTKEQTVSIFDIMNRLESRVKKMDLSRETIQRSGEIVLADTTQALLSDLALLTIDPTHEFMQQQKRLSSQIGIE